MLKAGSSLTSYPFLPGFRFHPAKADLVFTDPPIAIYTWDVAFRAATVVGFFGGGGMGLYLKRTVQSLETQRVAAILLTIIALVTVAELGSGWLRSRVRDWR